MAPKNIVIFGSTGMTGKVTLAQAVDGGYNVTVLERDPARLPASMKLARVVVGDVRNKEDVSKAVEGQDAVIIVLGTSGDLGLGVNLLPNVSVDLISISNQRRTNWWNSTNAKSCGARNNLAILLIQHCSLERDCVAISVSGINVTVEYPAGRKSHEPSYCGGGSYHSTTLVSLSSSERSRPTTLLSEGTRNIVEAMKKHGVRKVVGCMSSFVQWDISKVPRSFLPLTEDHIRMYEILKDSGLDYVAVLPPMIAADKHFTGDYTIKVGERGGDVISTGDLSHFFLRCLNTDEYDGKKVTLSRDYAAV